jgi:hypothetical protein
METQFTAANLLIIYFDWTVPTAEDYSWIDQLGCRVIVLPSPAPEGERGTR